MTVYYDAVKLELESEGRTEGIGWYDDEVSAIAAAFERSLITSALVSDLRRLPEVVIACRYEQRESGRTPQRFRRAVKAKRVANGRRIVMRPGIYRKQWMAGVA